MVWWLIILLVNRIVTTKHCSRPRNRRARVVGRLRHPARCFPLDPEFISAQRWVFINHVPEAHWYIKITANYPSLRLLCRTILSKSSTFLLNSNSLYVKLKIKCQDINENAFCFLFVVVVVILFFEPMHTQKQWWGFTPTRTENFEQVFTQIWQQIWANRAKTRALTDST